MEGKAIAWKLQGVRLAPYFGQEEDGGLVFINDDAKKRLLEDADVEISKMGMRASGVIVTSDIAYAAKYTECVKAGEWLDELADRVGFGRKHSRILLTERRNRYLIGRTRYAKIYFETVEPSMTF